jgi:hypothetical protein
MAEGNRIAAYVLLLDGVGTVFATVSGLTAWAIAEGFTGALEGLELPHGLGCGIDLRDGGFTDQSITLRIQDLDGSLPALFGGSLAGAAELVDTLEPWQDPAPGGTWEQCIGLEQIGPNGERRMFSCWPGFAVGLRHVGSQQAWAVGLDPSPITSTPRLWTGRRWTVWRVLYEGGAWQTLEQAQLVGLGTLLGQGTVYREAWEFRCTGVEGWIGGNLGAGSLADPLDVAPVGKVEDAFAATVSASLVLARLSDFEVGHEWVSPLSATAISVGLGAITYGDLVTDIQGLLATVEADASSGWAFNAADSSLSYSTSAGADGFTVQWNISSEVAGGFILGSSFSDFAVRLRVSMHESLWTLLGYDVRSQPIVDPVEDQAEYCQFSPSLAFADHWVGSFWSAAPQAMLAQLTGDFAALELTTELWDYPSNFQGPRLWPPIYAGGASTWTLQAGQEFQILTSNPVHFLGTLSRPVMADPDDPFTAIEITDVGVATHQGLVVVEGPYRRVGDTDGAQSPAEGYAFDIELERKLGRTKQVFRVAWRQASDGSMSTDTEGRPRAVVYRVEDPRVWGFEFEQLHGPWSGWRQAPEGGRDMTVQPLIGIEYGSDDGNQSSLLMRRILATTGSATTWKSDDTLAVDIFGTQWATPTLEAGANDKAAPLALDAEVAQLGLGVPADLIGGESDWAAWDGVGEHVSRAIVVSAGATSARAVLNGLLAPAGLCWSFAGGRLGVIDPTRFPSPDEVSLIVVTPSDYAGKPGDPLSAQPTQELREWAPIDLAEISGTREPTSATFRTKVSRRATDPGATGRAQTIVHKITAPHAVNRSTLILGSGWLSETYSRFSETCTFWCRPHFVVEARLHADDAANVWPGDGLLLTDPWLVDPSGAAEDYGIIAAIGRVTKRVYSARDEVVTITALLNAETAITLYSPAAVVTEYVVAGGNYSLAASDDWLGCRLDGSFDVEGFAEPYWSTDGTAMQVEGFAWNGVGWSRGIYGEVVSVVASTGACSLVLSGPLTGATYYRDHHHVFVPRRFADQTAAWALRYFAALCLEDGSHDTGTAGKTFVD